MFFSGHSSLDSTLLATLFALFVQILRDVFHRYIRNRGQVNEWSFLNNHIYLLIVLSTSAVVGLCIVCLLVKEKKKKKSLVRGLVSEPEQPQKRAFEGSRIRMETKGDVQRPHLVIIITSIMPVIMLRLHTYKNNQTTKLWWYFIV
jgi:hypothetical protein